MQHQPLILGQFLHLTSHCSLSYWVFCNISQSWFKNPSVRTHPAESGGWTIKKAWAVFKSLFQSPWLCLLYLWCHVISVFISNRNLGRVVEYGPGCHKNKDNNLYWKCSLGLFLDLCTHQDLPFLIPVLYTFPFPRSLLFNCSIILKYPISSFWSMYVFWFDIQSCYISSVHPVLPATETGPLAASCWSLPTSYCWRKLDDLSPPGVSAKSCT